MCCDFVLFSCLLVFFFLFFLLFMFLFFFFFFFFSSRRRHTRSTRDWSSDVCSSDLDYFIAMEYIDGSDLERLLGGSRARHEQVPLRVAFTLARRICDGLDAAQDRKSVV